MYRAPHAAPQSQLPEDRRGRVVGRFCHGCGSIYPDHSGKHVGKPVYGKDHISAPCSEEGKVFAPGAAWWEPAVEVLPAAPPAASNAA